MKLGLVFLSLEVSLLTRLFVVVLVVSAAHRCADTLTFLLEVEFRRSLCVQFLVFLFRLGNNLLLLDYDHRLTTRVRRLRRIQGRRRTRPRSRRIDIGLTVGEGGRVLLCLGRPRATPPPFVSTSLRRFGGALVLKVLIDRLMDSMLVLVSPHDYKN